MSRKPLLQWSRFIRAGVYYKECVKTNYCGIKRKLTCNISYSRDDFLSGCPNTKNRIENTTRGGVFWTKFEVVGQPMKRVSLWYICQLIYLFIEGGYPNLFRGSLFLHDEVLMSLRSFILNYLFRRTLQCQWDWNIALQWKTHSYQLNIPLERSMYSRTWCTMLSCSKRCLICRCRVRYQTWVRYLNSYT